MGPWVRPTRTADTATPVMRKLPVAPRLAVISGRDEAAVSAASLAYGFDSWTTDWRVVVERPDIDIVDICTPPGTHAELIKAASLNGKAVICEKPLAVSLSDARASLDAVTKSKVLNAIGFELPAATGAFINERASRGRGDR